jgi:hypothetical protein
MPMVVYTEDELVEKIDHAVADELKAFAEKAKARIEALALNPDLRDIRPEDGAAVKEGYRRGAVEAYWAMHDVLTNVVDPIS